MSGPLINIFTYTIKPGKDEEARKRIAELVDFVETNEPRVIACHVYLHEDGNALTIVQVHPDSASGTCMTSSSHNRTLLKRPTCVTRASGA